MRPMTHRIIASVAALALLAPAAALAKDGPKGEPGKGHAKPKTSASGKGRAKPRTFVFKGTVAAVDAEGTDVTVAVTRGNRAARRFVGRQVTFDVATAKLVVADIDGDGAPDADDVRPGDAVVVQARLPRSVTATAPLPARRLVDLTSPPADED
jgi:hypothetical protein